MDYKYYKDKYQTISIKLDRVKDADVIMILDSMPEGVGPKECIVAALRTVGVMLGLQKGGVNKWLNYISRSR